jgi:hypothetical protein
LEREGRESERKKRNAKGERAKGKTRNVSTRVETHRTLSFTPAAQPPESATAAREGDRERGVYNFDAVGGAGIGKARRVPDGMV